MSFSKTGSTDIFNDPLADLGIEANALPKKKKKDDKVYIDEPKLQQACQDLIQARSQKKDAEARMARAEAKIIPVAEEARLAESTKRGENLSTVGVNDMVRVSTPDKYSVISKDNIGAVSEALGDEISDYIEVETTINLKPELASDKEALRKIIEMLGGGSEPEQLLEGKKKLNEMFNIDQKYKVKSSFHNAYATKPEFREKTKDLLDNKVIKRTKSSVLPL